MKKYKKVYRVKPLGKIILFSLIVIIVLYVFITTINAKQDTKSNSQRENIKSSEKLVLAPLNDVLEQVEEKEVIEQDIEQETQIETQGPIYQDTYTTRMTSYYPEEGETMTASGLGINNFQVNENGWFTYDGKVVIATASTRLGYTEMRTYNLYDELTINIDGIDYQAIVLDVCGACQKYNRIDLFASSVVYAKDTMVEVRR